MLACLCFCLRVCVFACVSPTVGFAFMEQQSVSHLCARPPSSSPLLPSPPLKCFSPLQTSLNIIRFAGVPCRALLLSFAIVSVNWCFERNELPPRVFSNTCFDRLMSQVYTLQRTVSHSKNFCCQAAVRHGKPCHKPTVRHGKRLSSTVGMSWQTLVVNRRYVTVKSFVVN